MQQFKHILFVTHDVEHDLSAVEQALNVANDYQAKLSILLVCPAYPGALDPYIDSYQAKMLDDAKQRIEDCQRSLGLSLAIEKYEIIFGTGNKSAVHIIQQVLHDKNDLLIKAPEKHAVDTGFKALDMDLIRKCPIPVWLHRPMHHTLKNAYIAVAVDAEEQEENDDKIAVKLLKTADKFAIASDHDLSILTCWDFPLENSLRNSPFVGIPEEHLQKMVHDQEMNVRKALDALIARSALKAQIQVSFERGVPDHVIPKIIEKHKIDILVMGTMGRTGLPGFFVGNTAENILQKVSCSLIALKPDGFVSPIKEK